MSNVIAISRNAENIRTEMLLLKDVLLPLCKLEEENTFSEGKGQKSPSGLFVSHTAKYTRTFNRETECAMGKQYYDACEILLNAFTKTYWFEQARLANLETLEDFHGVKVIGENYNCRSGRNISQMVRFECDWRKDLGIDMIVRIKFTITGTEPHEMIVDFIRNLPQT